MRETRLPVFAIAALAIAFQIMAISSARVSGQTTPPYSPNVDKPHSDFKLPSIEDGAPVRLSDFRGRKLLLIHFASW